MNGATLDGLGALEVCDRAGVTYRQVDYWTTRGYLEAITPANPGTGCHRYYPGTEVAVARLLAVIAPFLGSGSLVTVEDALRVAGLVRCGVRARVVLTPGVLLDLEEICGEAA